MGDDQDGEAGGGQQVQTALEGGVDVLLFLDGNGESRTLTHRGGRLGVDPPPLNFMLAEDVGLEVLGVGRPTTGNKLAEVLRAVRELGEPTTAEVARHLGWGDRTALRWLRVLEDRLKVTHVERIGGVGGGREATWRPGINWRRITAPTELTDSSGEGS